MDHLARRKAFLDEAKDSSAQLQDDCESSCHICKGSRGFELAIEMATNFDAIDRHLTLKAATASSSKKDEKTSTESDEKAKKEFDRLKKFVDAQRKHVSKLEQDKKAAKEKFAAVEAERKSLADQRADLTTKLAEANAKYSSAEKMIAQLNNDKRMLEEKLESLTKKHQEAEKTITKASHDLEQAGIQVFEYKKNADKANEELVKTQAENARRKKLLRATLTSMDECRGMIGAEEGEDDE